MKGMSKAEWEQGNSTRSGLLWEVERILKELNADELPQVLLMENVPQVHPEQNKPDFEYNDRQILEGRQSQKKRCPVFRTS